MKRILCYIVILVAMRMLPVERSDVGKLRPVQAVAVYETQGNIIMKTDTEDMGVGATAQEALQNLKDTTAGIIYLDTAEYLLLTEKTQEAAEQLRPWLKNSVKLCVMDMCPDMKEAVKFLEVHGKLPTLKQWQKGEKLPEITCRNGRIIFSKKVEKRA